MLIKPGPESACRRPAGILALLIAGWSAVVSGMPAPLSGETLAEIFARKIARTKASPFYREIHTPTGKRSGPRRGFRIGMNS